MNDILNMQAGPKLDELVGTKVMGWKRKYNNVSGNCWFHERGLPVHEWKPSTDLTAAWEVFEYLRKQGYGWQIFTYYRTTKHPISDNVFIDIYHESNSNRLVVRVDAPSAPEAISKAALLALEGNRGD